MFDDRPAWQQQVRPRLAVCMFVALLLLATVFVLVKFSPLPVLQDRTLELRLLAAIKPSEAEPAEPQERVEPEATIEPFETTEPVELDAAAELAGRVEPAEPQAIDWYADAHSAVQKTVTTANHVDSMHPAFDEKRRQAAINFRASRAPVIKPIWENVETDQMGRKILVSGDCYRVLEDPRATYYEIHRQFGQYITYCNANNDKPMGVAWVEENREGYAYLNYRDGEIPRDQIIALTRRSASLSQSHSHE